jgi:hypothetical protein
LFYHRNQATKKNRETTNKEDYPKQQIKEAFFIAWEGIFEMEEARGNVANRAASTGFIKSWWDQERTGQIVMEAASRTKRQIVSRTIYFVRRIWIWIWKFLNTKKESTKREPKEVEDKH